MNWDTIFLAIKHPNRIKLSKNTPKAISNFKYKIVIDDIINFDIIHAKKVMILNNLSHEIIGSIQIKKKLYSRDYKKLVKLSFYFEKQSEATLFKMCV